MRRIFPRSKCPDALVNFQKKCRPISAASWDKLHSQEPILYQEIRNTLAHDQDGVCIYCERLLDLENQNRDLHGHVEHFKPKKNYPSLTLSWDNLMHSCQQNKSCGHFKGNNYFDGLLNPYEDSIEDWIEFSLTTGEILISSQAPPERRDDISKSLLILGLNEPGLKSRRKNLLESLQQQLLDIIRNNPDALQPFLEIVGEKKSPFMTAREQLFRQMKIK